MGCVVCGYVTGESFTFKGRGFVLVTITITIVTVNFVLVDNNNSRSPANFGPRVFDSHHVIITPTIAIVNFMLVVFKVLGGDGGGRMTR